MKLYDVHKKTGLPIKKQVYGDVIRSDGPPCPNGCGPMTIARYWEGCTKCGYVEAPREDSK